MTTVMTEESASGRRRYCNARCHDAKGNICRCICGGKYHGVTSKNVLRAIADLWFEQPDDDKIPISP